MNHLDRVTVSSQHIAPGGLSKSRGRTTLRNNSCLDSLSKKFTVRDQWVWYHTHAVTTRRKRPTRSNLQFAPFSPFPFLTACLVARTNQQRSFEPSQSTIAAMKHPQQGFRATCLLSLIASLQVPSSYAIPLVSFPFNRLFLHNYLLTRFRQLKELSSHAPFLMSTQRQVLPLLPNRLQRMRSSKSPTDRSKIRLRAVRLLLRRSLP